MTSPADNIDRTIMCLQSGMVLPPDVAQWLLKGLESFRGDGVPLETALMLGIQPGGAYDRLHVVRDLEKRDTMIRALHHWIGSDLTPWQAAGEVLELFDTSPSKPIPSCHPVIFILNKLDQSGFEIPTSKKQIARILQGDRSC